MRQFRCTDPERQRSKRPVGGCVAVSADKCAAWLGDAQFRTDHMCDTLSRIVEIKKSDAILTRQLTHLLDKIAMIRVQDIGDLSAIRAHEVIRCGEAEIRPAYFQAAIINSLEAGTCSVVHHMAINIEQAVTVRALYNDVRIPQLVIKCPRYCHCPVSCVLLDTDLKALRRSSQSAAAKRENTSTGLSPFCGRTSLSRRSARS